MRFDLRCFGRFGRWMHSVLFYDHWMIGVIDQPVENALRWQSLPPVRWIEAPDRDRYLADPMPWPGSADTLLAESFDLGTRRGRIVQLRLADGSIAAEHAVDFGLPGHLSFPFLFRHQGDTYALPESAAMRRLQILRWRDSTWQVVATVLDDVPVADAILFEHAGLFWIAYTDISIHPHDNLHLLYARDLSGPWQPHAANPVQRGLACSRNAGPVFAADERLYRPTQDCARHYGAAIRIMEITTCTPTAYVEREAHYLPPHPDRPDGLHTLAGWGERCLIDGMRFRFSPSLVAGKITRRLRRLLRMTKA